MPVGFCTPTADKMVSHFHRPLFSQAGGPSEGVSSRFPVSAPSDTAVPLVSHKSAPPSGEGGVPRVWPSEAVSGRGAQAPPAAPYRASREQWVGFAPASFQRWLAALGVADAVELAAVFRSEEELLRKLQGAIPEGDLRGSVEAWRVAAQAAPASLESRATGVAQHVAGSLGLLSPIAGIPPRPPPPPRPQFHVQAV